MARKIVKGKLEEVEVKPEPETGAQQEQEVVKEVVHELVPTVIPVKKRRHVDWGG